MNKRINRLLKKNDLPQKEDTIFIKVDVKYYNDMILTENLFFDLFRNYRIIAPSDEVLKDWQYSPWCTVDIYDGQESYYFEIFLGGMCLVKMPDGDRGAVLFDLEKIKFNKIDLDRTGEYFTVSNFNLIKDFVLLKGDRRTYCNMYCNNPHYRFGFVDVFLDPSLNINCDHSKPDFDIIVIKISNNYYDVKYDKEKNSLKLEMNYTRNRNLINKGYIYFMEVLNMIENYK